MKSLRIVASTMSPRHHLMKRATSIAFVLQKRMFSENNASFTRANVPKLQFPWNEDNNLMMMSLFQSESFMAKIVRKGFFFLEVDGLSEKDFLAGALTAYEACSDSIFEYCQEVQQLIQQDPSSLTSLASHPALEQGRERLKTYLEYSLGNYILKKIHKYYEANPSAEVVYKREEAVQPAVEVEEKKKDDDDSGKLGLTITIKLIPQPRTFVRKSRFARYNFPSKNKAANKIFIDWMKKLFPVEYNAYDRLLNKNDQDDNEVSLEVRAMLVVVQIPLRELFYIKDKSSGALLQGSTESHFQTHTVR